MFPWFPHDNNWILLNSHGLKMCYLIEIILGPVKAHIFSVSHGVCLFSFFFGKGVYLNAVLMHTTFSVTSHLFIFPPVHLIISPVVSTWWGSASQLEKGQSYQEVWSPGPTSVSSAFFFLSLTLHNLLPHYSEGEF